MREKIFSELVIRERLIEWLVGSLQGQTPRPAREEPTSDRLSHRDGNGSRHESPDPSVLLLCLSALVQREAGRSRTSHSRAHQAEHMNDEEHHRYTEDQPKISLRPQDREDP